MGEGVRAFGFSLLTLVLAACTDAARPPKDIVATVNGRPITATEVGLRQAGKNGPETPAEAREALVVLELQAQRAIELGLDADEGFQAGQQRAEAQLREARRRELAKLYRTKEVLDQITVSDDEARQYFEANRARVQTQLTVHQILVNGRAAATAAAAELAAGKPFEEVAAAQLPVQIPGQTPWALPTLAWEQVPTQWWDAIDALKPGEVSGPIAGASDRFWIVKLIARAENPAVTRETALPRIQAVIKGLKFEERRAQLDAELRARAAISLSSP